ncbi:TPA: DUF551 domain-containing protein [Klebsiella pneumoniae subsp. pneumoniae]|nr:DUF551 domain-containing protein [Klebsiella pneumoniae]HDU3706724.1 DUF551 domain-containing protein [Klebsiella pneumoniae subsp. pneumoniae]HDU3759545.1 DUF551 domain-containing protein [Klebsiella pneumoniae]HDU5914375.1 DUF551 domain-containing protein [Klebsiella pneumoniae subsp. pneumoniae]
MSEFSRETLLNIIETDHVQCGEASALARMALAAMDSEPVEMPLDYLQGHKDGLEWAAQLAESNHPQTGDWLYDDPIELAKAIRKGPDMPPSQPALDTKPVAYTDERNLGYIDRGRETAYLWGKQNSEASDVALYRHAQPVPVVPNEIKHRIGGLDWGWEGEFNRGWNACRAAMLEADPQLPGSDSAPVPGSWIPVSERLPDENAEQQVLACFKGGDISTLYYFEGRWDDAYGIVPIRQDVTHWMPLPAAPQEAINVLIPLVSRNEREVK